MKMNEIKVAFYLKRRGQQSNQTTNDGIFPVIGRITVGKETVGFATKLKIEGNLWDVKSGRAVGRSKAATNLNRELSQISVSVHARYRELMAKGSLPTAVAVKNAFQGIATAQKTLCVLYQEMLDEFQSRVGIDRSKATLEEYQKGYKYLCDFLKEKYHVHDMALIQLDLAFVESYDHYLRINRRLKAGTAVIMFIPLRKVVLTAVRRNLIVHYPFAGYKFEQPRLEMRSLSAEELQRLLSTPQQTPTLSLIRDIFAFAAFTGISHADLERMTWENIQVMEDGSRWLSMKRQKTGIPFLVKLLDIPLQLMERYRGMARGSLVFPYLSLSRVNVGLKQVAQQCGIDKSLSFHVARHTFGTVVCLSQGVPIESVSRMLGHRRITTTQRYARVDKKKIGDDMKRFAKCIETKFNFKIHAHGNE